MEGKSLSAPGVESELSYSGPTIPLKNGDHRPPADENDVSVASPGFGSVDGEAPPEGRPGRLMGECFNCGEVGHNKADCPEPRKFTGTCRVCQETGHPGAQCPERVCDNCKEKGHVAVTCTNNRKLDDSKIAEKSAEEAWENLRKADGERDLDDIREAIKIYVKAVPDATYPELERAFRRGNFHTHLIALDKEIAPTHTYMNLQGKLGCKYMLQIQFSARPTRATKAEAFPKTPEENTDRLKDAGIPVHRGISYCTNCGEVGHIARSCPQEKEKSVQPEIKCVNCQEVGHRARDCAKNRFDPDLCRNCKQPGHYAKDCTEPRSAEGVECRYCKLSGHFAKDCPNREKRTCRNCGSLEHLAKDCDQPPKIQCRNCDEEGHTARECKKPRDMSRVRCNKCFGFGHTQVRCKSAGKEKENADFAAAGAAEDGGNAEFKSIDDGFGSGGFDTAPEPLDPGEVKW